MNRQSKSNGKRVSIFNFKEQTHMKTKILTLMVFSILGVVFITACVAIGMAYRTTMQTIETFMQESAEIGANNVKSTIEANLKTVEEFASRAYFTQFEIKPKEAESYCNEFAKRQGFIGATYADSKGVDLTGKDVTDRAYFEECKKTGKGAISDLVISKGSNEMIVVLAAPVLLDGKFHGIIIVQAEAGFLSDVTDKISIGESGSCYMLDAKGNTIAHTNRDNVLNAQNLIESAKSDSSLKSIAALQEKMIGGGAGFDTYTYQGTNKMLGYAPVGINGWSIGLAGTVTEFMGGLYIAIALIIVIIIISLIVIVSISTKQIKKMIAPLQVCAERIVLLGKGDLETEFPKIDTKDEIGVMAQSAKDMVDSMRDIITDVDYVLGEMAQGKFNVESQKKQSYKGDFAGLLSSIVKLNTKLSDALVQIDQAGLSTFI